MGNCVGFCKMSGDPISVNETVKVKDEIKEIFSLNTNNLLNNIIVNSSQNQAIIEKVEKETQSNTKGLSDTDIKLEGEKKAIPNQKNRTPNQLISANGVVYNGDLKKGLKHGLGKQVWQDGTVYEGEWFNDKACGKGKLIDGDGDIYEGDWQDDKANGQGVFKGALGSSYTGNWKNDLRHGKGSELWPDNSKYEGDYQNGYKTGEGRITYADGSWYEGSFFENYFHGYGTYYWVKEKKHEGDWKSNKMSGFGKTLWNNGDWFLGSFESDKRTGLGKLWDEKNNRQWIGYWKDGKENGKGILIEGKSNGKKIKGEWKEGVRVKMYDEEVKEGFEEIEKVLGGKNDQFESWERKKI